ncbi:MAG: heparinase II/III family protein, partial [Sphingomonadaceae bacterium]|nr:heparinase II/III family protein [Sphingomonadaceae bacterium]
MIYSFLSQGKIEMADEALDDIWDIGPRATPVKIAPITWHENPHDKYWRFIFYGLRPLSNLLRAYYTTGKVAYRDKILEVLRSYNAFEVARGDREHAYLDDPHTAAFRAMVLVNIHGKFSRTNDLPADVAAGLRASIEKLGFFLEDERHFEDGQNHGFNEAAALLTIAVNFPEMREASAWQALALERLERLMVSTVDDDGVEVENSPFYHFYVLTFVLQDSKWMDRFGVPKPPGFDAQVARMFDYATYGVQPDGLVPLLGASVKYNASKAAPEVYSAGALLSADDEFGLIPAFNFVRSLGKGGVAPTVRNKRFDVSGQGFMRSGFSSGAEFKNDTYVTFNVGNHRNNHNHADALGITLYTRGKSLLPDSGLFEYGSIKAPEPFPVYFRSTRAHNTVVVDGQDQNRKP